MIDISKKVEEIRQKPEHIRWRYVWGMVTISMILIIIVWIFSLKSKLPQNSRQGSKEVFERIKNEEVIKNSSEEIENLTETIKSNVENIKNMKEEDLIKKDETESEIEPETKPEENLKDIND